MLIEQCAPRPKLLVGSLHMHGHVVPDNDIGAACVAALKGSAWCLALAGEFALGKPRLLIISDRDEPTAPEGDLACRFNLVAFQFSYNLLPAGTQLAHRPYEVVLPHTQDRGDARIRRC